MDCARRPLIAFLDAARQGAGPPDAATRRLGPPETVPLPPMPVGSQMLARMALDESPAGAGWRDDAYGPSSSGNTATATRSSTGRRASSASATRSSPDPCCTRSNWRRARRRRRPRARRAAQKPLGGTWLSLLVGGHANYYHWMIEGLGRLALADPDMLAATRQVLVPGPSAGFCAASLALSGLWPAAPCCGCIPARPSVYSMVVPWSHLPRAGAASPARPVLRQARGEAVPAVPARPWPRRIYVDRRGATHRRSPTRTPSSRRWPPAASPRSGWRRIRSPTRSPCSPMLT